VLEHHDQEADRDRSAATTDAVVGEAYSRHRDELVRHALRYTFDPETAADVVQDAFVQLVREIDRGTPPLNVRAWLYRVTTNAAISRRRRARVAADWAAGQLLPDAFQGPEDGYLVREHELEIHALLAHVSLDERRALLMAAHGVPGEAIGTALGRSHVATRALLRRARGRLRAYVTASVVPHPGQDGAGAHHNLPERLTLLESPA
jgi:RNA polymerase sigma-70 factor (ECF subfamily)